MQIYSNTVPNKAVPTNKVRQEFVGDNRFSNKNINFKGGIPKVTEVIKVDDALKILEKEVGTSAKEHFDKIISNLTSKQDSGVKLKDGILEFDKDTTGGKLYRAIIDPVIHFPIDFAISTLGFLKKIPGFKNAKFIDDLRGKGILGRRNKDLENYSNTMALQHCFEMLGDKKLKKEIILQEALKRFKIGQTEYTVKGERSLTRLVSGIIPAFFLANDAYNLSMYVNNNKDMAKKEKKRRFYQELSRVTVTALATFGALGYFSKKVSSDPAMATGIIAGLTFASELIGRMLVGTPVYPLGKDGAKQYAKLQHKDNLNQNKDKNVDSKSDKNGKSKSNYALKLLGGIVIAGFLIDKRNSIKSVRKFLNKLSFKYKEIFAKDYKIKRSDFDRIVAELRKNEFDGIADRFEKKKTEIINQGNLTTKERIKVEREINNKLEEFMPDGIIFDEDKLKKAISNAREEIDKKEIIQSFNFPQKDKDDFLYINGDLNKFFDVRVNISKTKDNIVNRILALPIKFAWEIINMPYQYFVKPLIEVPFKGKDMLRGKAKSKNCDEVFRDSVEYLYKNTKSPDFKEKVNKHLIDAFDNVNKSNLSSADLAGSAKNAVSAVTSVFLVLDNYNMVMIDSEGKNKKLAEQKAKERTIQRIVRIAYGAALIKFFNGIFKSQFDASLLGAEAVTAGSVLVTETLERTSVGLPLHEATKEEIIEKDNAALNATGLKGAYFRFMSKLTGKKPLSEKKAGNK